MLSQIFVTQYLRQNSFQWNCLIYTVISAKNQHFTDAWETGTSNSGRQKLQFWIKHDLGTYIFKYRLLIRKARFFAGTNQLDSRGPLDLRNPWGEPQYKGWQEYELFLLVPWTRHSLLLGRHTKYVITSMCYRKNYIIPFSENIYNFSKKKRAKFLSQKIK